MSEQPVGAQDAAPPRAEHAADNGSGPTGYPPSGYHPYDVPAWRFERPRVVIKADLLPAVSTLFTVSLFGLAVGWLWSLLAPPQRMVIAQDGKAVPLTAESFHRFDDLALFTVMGLGAGLCTGLAVWFLRERRGPVMLVAAVLGAAAGGWLAMRVGLGWAEGRYPVGGDVKVLDVVVRAPQLESGWVLLAWPLTAALVYGVMAAWNSTDDLGRRLG